MSNKLGYKFLAVEVVDFLPFNKAKIKVYSFDNRTFLGYDVVSCADLFTHTWEIGANAEYGVYFDPTKLGSSTYTNYHGV